MATAFGMDCELLLSFKSPTSAVLGGDTRTTSDRFALASLVNSRAKEAGTRVLSFPLLSCLDSILNSLSILSLYLSYAIGIFCDPLLF